MRRTLFAWKGQETVWVYSNFTSTIGCRIARYNLSHSIGVTYLDHAGATLYSACQLEAHFKDLTSNLYGNPHSQNQSSTTASETISHVRRLVLQHFNTTSSDYDIVFTSGCTGALKLLSDSFPFTPDVTSLPSKDSKNVRQISTTSGAHEEIATHKKHVWYQGSEGDCITAPQEFWSSGQSVFCYLEDNHTSVVGMREVAARRGAGLACVTREDVLSSASNVTGVGGDTLKPGVGGDTLKPGVGGNTLKPGVGGDTLKPGVGGNTLKPGVGGNTLKPEDIETAQCQKEDGSAGNNMVETRPHTSPDFTRRSDVYHLFAYPAQSNFSGHKYPLSWTRDVPSGGVVLRGMEGLLGAWLVLLDAAAYVPTSPLDLASFPAHFVTLSFYKMFGFPTGLGALLVRHDVAHLLHKDYYGGGTVLASISRKNFHIAKPQLHERLGGP